MSASTITERETLITQTKELIYVFQLEIVRKKSRLRNVRQCNYFKSRDTTIIPKAFLL